ncbi:hypothetical protein [Hymenobacter actinosclerus]|uniref:DUF4142 domain-containing protein n=1 Tax=Hymenobacter actinosclerus TaxID=82805 RepID=A0A1I0IK71_9BACT|nr:hypothetical protein [Hymenobacter actinosclerus]SET97156.1 hypothetical protein SAMN04487998_3338 [Hymenobacter actinosclerus]
MKHYLLPALATLLATLLAGCGSDAATRPNATGPGATTETSAATPRESVNPDPRAATIRQQHEQLLATQKQYLEQLGQLQGYEKLSPARAKESTEYFAWLIEQSEANLTALGLLDGSKYQDPAQIALVGEIATKQAHYLNLAKKKLAGIHNEHYLPQ